MKGILFIISAPAGTGKTTLVDMLLKEFDRIERTITYTTRKPRKDETEGQDYFFITKEAFEQKKSDFLEWAEVFHDDYGTSKAAVLDALKTKHVVLVIDTQGAMHVLREMPAVSIFISPPNIKELEVRLRKRETEDEKEVTTRLSWAKKEMEMSKHYDYHIVNEDLLNAYDVLRAIVLAEEHRTIREIL